MMVKEKDAAEMWCPMSRAIVDSGRDLLVVNRPIDQDGQPKIVAANACLGSRCMLWVPVKANTGRCGLSYGA
jgi:hypothetical protein